MDQGQGSVYGLNKGQYVSLISLCPSQGSLYSNGQGLVYGPGSELNLGSRSGFDEWTGRVRAQSVVRVKFSL